MPQKSVSDAINIEAIINDWNSRAQAQVGYN